MDLNKLDSSPYKNKLQGLVKKANSYRLHKDSPVDMTFAEIVQKELQVDVNVLYESLGVNLAFDTIENMFTTPDTDVRWLIPEIFRDSLRLGYRLAPIWPNITAAEEVTTGLSQVLPSINMADASPKRVGEGETIPLGTLTYQSKKFDIHKFGRGIKITDEVARYVSLAVISLYFQDFGVKMGMGVDTLAINTLINGEQADGSEAAPVIGVGTSGTLTFRDILKVWIRMNKIGRIPTTMIGSEDVALTTMDLAEFKTPLTGTTPYRLNVKTPLPQGADYYIHGNIGTDQQLILDPRAALLKLNAMPLMVESERIVSNQTEAFYASFTLGFAKMFTDACLILDKSKAFSGYGFPAAMDIYGPMNQPMGK